MIEGPVRVWNKRKQREWRCDIVVRVGIHTYGSSWYYILNVRDRRLTYSFDGSNLIAYTKMFERMSVAAMEVILPRADHLMFHRLCPKAAAQQ